MVHLRVEFDVKFCFHRSDDALFEADDFLRKRLAGVVHDDERLLVINCRIAAALALPSALFDEPCSRNLDLLYRFLDFARNDSIES